MQNKNRTQFTGKRQKGQANLWGAWPIFTLLLILALGACNPAQAPKTSTNIPKSTGMRPPAAIAVSITPTVPVIQTATAHPTQTVSPTQTPTPDYFAQDYPLSENEYLIPLTIRHVTEETAFFFFELRNPAEGKLVYRDTATQTQKEIPFTAAETRQMLEVEGLSAGTHFEAQIILGDAPGGFQQPGFAGQTWGTIGFHTMPDELPLRVGVLGDASFGDEATQTLVERIAAQNLDFIIHTGDVVYETEASDIFNTYLRKFFEPFKPLLHQGPIYTVMGNHDYDLAVRWEDAPFYDYAFPPFPNPEFDYPETRRGNQYYAFAYQDIQFLMLDTHIFAGAAGRTEQDTWIVERLTDPRFRLTIPVFHVAPYSSSIVHPNDGLPVRYSWNWRFEEANVPLVLSGHFHHYERLTANQITYIVSGGGSSTLYAQGDLLPESQIYARKTHFVQLEIYEDHIELSTISLAGEILDQTFIPLE